MAAQSVSRDIVIDADATTIFDVLADPSQHALFDGSDSVRGRVSGPPRLYLGARFRMRMRLGIPYLITNQVVEYAEDRCIAWRHFGRHVWRYELAPADGERGRPATRVTETFDWGPALASFAYPAAGIPERNAAAIEATLQRLKVLVESRSVVTP